MAANKTSIIKGKRKAIASRAKARRKVAVKKAVKPEKNLKKPPMEASANQPRKRNALGEIQLVEIVPARVSEPESDLKPRPVAISKALYEEAPADFDAPWVLACRDEPSEEDTSRNRGRMLGAIIVTTLMLGLFNSGALVNRVRSLPAGPIEDRIITSSEAWHEWMEAQGIAEYIVNMRKCVQSLKETDW